MKLLTITAFAAAFAVAAPAAAQTITYNTNPTTPFTYGAGNDYTPANAAVLTNGNLELASRFHVNGLPADPSDSAGVYSFALGTANINFDYSAVNFAPLEGATVLLTNLLTGDTASYNILAIPDANGAGRGYQGSQQLRFGFLNGTFPPFGDLNFDANVNNTYRFDLSTGGNTLTTFAKVGLGAPGAVPEPATWAMMILGFGLVGSALRRRQNMATRVSYAV